MQERSFEKQVKEKMEELSLTPSEPVWKKINVQVGKKRDRRRIFLWLPLAALLLGGGVWFVSGNVQQNSNVQVNNSFNETANQEKGKENTDAKFENGSTKTIDKSTKKDLPTVDGSLENKTTLSEEKMEENKTAVATGGNQKAILVNREKKPFIPSRKTAVSNNQTNQILSGNKKQTLTQTGQPSLAESTNIDKPNLSTEKNQTVTENISGNKMLSDTGLQQPIIQEERNAVENTTIPDSASIKTPEPIKESDSLAIEKSVASANRKSVSKKWQFALEVGGGSSGVNNGIGVLGGGAKSMETNAFARDMNFSFAAPSNSPQGGFFTKPPSPQKKAGSFLFGLLAKKQLSKRSILTTGLRYNFYSTTMKVGQNVNRDTVVEANKSVGSFYTNSGNSFSDYHNNFHFISVPVILDFRVLNKLPLDLHFGLSVQQLISSNALLYSAASQVYYKDKEIFNKTYLFSEVGIEYSFQLAKGLSLRAGPKAGYSLSKVIRASDRHLFSYGLATQLVFAGK